MSRGLGKTERRILEYLTGCDEHGDRYCPKGSEDATYMAGIISQPMGDDWRNGHIEPTRGYVNSVLRAVRSLERKGHVTLTRHRCISGYVGRPDYLVVQVSADYLAGSPITQRLEQGTETI
jgi:hypothetical protein